MSFTHNTKVHLNELTEQIQIKLDELKAFELNNIDKEKNLIDAMWYSLTAGGKRIRPVLTLEFCLICGGDIQNALSAACALEMIHTFSLIHDDLPCMDDDDMRRGQPSCHIAFDEATALLAGDALLNYAYQIICNDNAVTSEMKIALISELTYSVGINGMIGGQVIDTTYIGAITTETLLDMYSKKTGALLKAACKMGCISANADEHKIKCAEIYAEKLGLAFQIIDDILDITGNEATLGKPTGSDNKSGKITYASLVGIEEARRTASSLTQDALKMLNEFENTEFINELTLYLLKRDY